MKPRLEPQAVHRPPKRATPHPSLHPNGLRNLRCLRPQDPWGIGLQPFQIPPISSSEWVPRSPFNL